MMDSPDPYALYEEAQSALASIPDVDWTQWLGTEILFYFFGLRFPRKIARLINRVYAGLVLRVIWVGPRGGGKSMTDAALELLLWFFRDFDVVNVGGSETQAANVYAYLQGFMQQYRDVWAEMAGAPTAPRLALTKETMSRTVRQVDTRRLPGAPGMLHVPTLTDPNGDAFEFIGTPMAKDTKAFVAVLAASQKQVRGPHAGSERRGGALIVDEEAEVAADISTAARYMVNTAVPSVIIRTSTNHNAIGPFAEDLANPDAKGLEKYHTSIFDIVKTCPYAVTTPDQWEAINNGTARAPGDTHKLVVDLPMMQPDCTNCPRPAYFRDSRQRLDATGQVKEVSPPLCGGAAAFAEHGWIPFDGPGGVLQQFDETPSVEEFEVELTGASPSTSGLVIKDRAGLDACLVDDAFCAFMPLEMGGGEVVGMVDWGLAGTCAVMLMQNRYDMNSPVGRRVILDVLDLGKQSDSVVYDQMETWRQVYGLAEIWADASHPYCNYNLTLQGFHVRAVKFAQEKALGAGSINGHIEHRALWIPKDAGKILHKQLAGWRKSDSGQIVKGNDHFPDALLCGLLKYQALVVGIAQAAMAGAREAPVVIQEANVTTPLAQRHMTPENTPSRTSIAAPLVTGDGGFRSVVPELPRARTVATASPVRGRPQARETPPTHFSIPPASLPTPPDPGASPSRESPMDKLMREAREKSDALRKP